MARTEAERFWQKVRKTDDCWLWTGYLSPTGHGTFWTGDHQITPHRWSYLKSGQEIPDGWIVHHECETPSCVRPDHLTATTRELHNSIHHRTPLKTHCKNGHELNEQNAYLWPGTRCIHRTCRICNREAQQRRNK